MATHSSVLAWRIRQNLVGCRLWGRTELDTAEATWQQQQQAVYIYLRQGSVHFSSPTVYTFKPLEK